MTTIFFSLLCLLAFASSAVAECAWVLWIGEYLVTAYKQDERPIKWTLVEAHPLLAACQQAQAGKIKALAEEKAVRQRVNSNILTKTFPGGYAHSNITRFDRVICVPDTVDPREPKGR